MFYLKGNICRESWDSLWIELYGKKHFRQTFNINQMVEELSRMEELCERSVATSDHKSIIDYRVKVIDLLMSSEVKPTRET